MQSILFPDQGNAITQSDINTGILRVTVNAKSFFPEKDSMIKIIFNKETKEIRLEKRIGRSDRLHIGKDVIKKLAITSISQIKFSKKSNTEFLLENISCYFKPNETDEITYKQLLNLREKYWKSLIENPFPKPPDSGAAVDMILYFKRKFDGKHHAIGPYTGISVFEAANRIASDLVIINGLIQLITEKKEPKTSIVTVRLGNKHIKGKGDFTINDKEGEAFNVASSFYKVKMRSTTKKWLDKNLSYILVNADLFDEIENLEINDEIIPVKNWDKF